MRAGRVLRQIVIARIADQVPALTAVVDRATEGMAYPYATLGASYWTDDSVECIEAREITLAMLALLILPLVILGLSATAALLPKALESLANAGPRGLTEILYAYSSAAGNNSVSERSLNVTNVSAPIGGRGAPAGEPATPSMKTGSRSPNSRSNGAP